MADYSLKAILETQVIDKLLPVIVKGDKDLEEKIAKMGTVIGQAATFAEFPEVDANGKPVTVNDVIRLTAKDGTHHAGMYARKPDNSGWEETPYIDFDSLDVAKIVEAAKADPDAIVIDETTGTITATEDGKFITPKQVGDALKKLNTANLALFHPKGGKVELAVVGKNAEENTQQFVTANQLAAAFTTEEIQAKYDAL